MDIASIDDINAATLRLNQIQQFPRVQLKCNDNHLTCSICIGDFITDDIILILPCVHKFHKCCIDTWLSKKNTCPTCREIVIHDVDEEIGETEDETDVEEEEELLDTSSEAMTPAQVLNMINSIGNSAGDSSPSSMRPMLISASPSDPADRSFETTTPTQVLNVIDSIGDLTGDSSESDVSPELISDLSSEPPILSSSSSGIAKIVQDSDDSLHSVHSIDSINSGGSLNEMRLDSPSEDWY